MCNGVEDRSWSLDLDLGEENLTLLSFQQMEWRESFLEEGDISSELELILNF
jgi:hypothetical protein